MCINLVDDFAPRSTMSKTEANKERRRKMLVSKHVQTWVLWVFILFNLFHALIIAAGIAVAGVSLNVMLFLRNGSECNLNIVIYLRCFLTYFLSRDMFCSNLKYRILKKVCSMFCEEVLTSRNLSSFFQLHSSWRTVDKGEIKTVKRKVG